LPRSVHPFYAGTQAHPELKSRPTRAHPLFRGLIGAALDYSDAERLPVQIHDEEAGAHNGVAVGAAVIGRSATR
jgi:CTP synthase